MSTSCAEAFKRVTHVQPVGHVRRRQADHERLPRVVRLGVVETLFLPGPLPALLDSGRRRSAAPSAHRTTADSPSPGEKNGCGQAATMRSVCPPVHWMHKAEGGRCPQESAPGGVALHPARVRRGLEDAARLAAGGAHAPERPGLGDDHVVPAASELLDRGSREARLDLDLSRPRLTRVEGAREVVRMEGGRIDRRLEVERRRARARGRSRAATGPAGRRPACRRRGTALRRGRRARD